MNCPRCKSGLVVVEYSDIELDWCPQCDGLWFDSGEMELLAMKTTHSEPNACLVPDEPATTDEALLRCPLCRKKMHKRLLGKEQPVIVDVCPRCDGLWLDGGELEQVLSQSASTDAEEDSSSSAVLHHIRETFASTPQSQSVPNNSEAGSVRE
ncbi:MAG: zf-TFIIB domain-containing protein [Dehalococcoidia bacterium]|nr:zf-TFIIB domain-containing protein [Dehalococcoidia bacterium]